MNPEKYKNEMSHKYPDKTFAEEVLIKAKKSAVPEKSNCRFLKAAGGIGLSAAVLVGTFFGAGAVRSLFKDINREEIKTTEEITEEITEETGRITATDDILAVTPLSNPKYTVKADTPDGKVSLDENTTPAEMLACGVPVSTDNGMLGVQYLCEAFRKYRNYEAFEFIIGDARTVMGANTYGYYNYDPEWVNPYYNYYLKGEGCTYWFYDHRYGQSITKHGGDIPFANLGGGTDGGFVSIMLNRHGFGEETGIATFYDTYKVTGYDKETRKNLYYSEVTYRAGTDSPPYLNIIYNGQCIGKYRINLFLEKIENGAEYAGIQFTDITTTDEYDERLYSIEYCQGVYSIFTMTNGLDGKFDTQYFDGYAVTDGVVVFDNGNVKYSFMLSEDVEGDIAQYGDMLNDSLCLYASCDVGVDHNISKNLELSYDKTYAHGIYKEFVLDAIVTDMDDSTEELNAVRVLSRKRYGNTDQYDLELKSDMTTLGIAHNGDVYYLSSVSCIAEDFYLADKLVEKDGEMLLMLTDEELETIKNQTPNTVYSYGDSGLSVNRRWRIEAYIYFGTDR